jgi:hypothetical protein
MGQGREMVMGQGFMDSLTKKKEKTFERNSVCLRVRRLETTGNDELLFSFFSFFFSHFFFPHLFHVLCCQRSVGAKAKPSM